MPSSNKLPLSALQTFTVVARLGSIRAAADELCLTHGAVSQQIKKLEKHLGQQLLEKRGRGIALTSAGRELSAQVSPLLDGLIKGVQHVGEDDEAGTLRIACTQDVMLGLLQFLEDFRTRYPNIILQFYDIPKGKSALPEVDLAILDTLPGSAAYGYTVLIKEKFFPVASPQLAEEACKSESWTLLHDDKGEVWQRWFTATKRNYPEPEQQLFLPNMMAVIVAAKRGLGVAIASASTVSEDLNRKQLVRLNRGEVEVEFPYFVVSLSPKVSSRAQCFSQWFKERCEA